MLIPSSIRDTVLMNLENERAEVKLGLVEGVGVWESPIFPDLRGRLFKAYVQGPIPSFPVHFETFEHFFTESKKGVFRGMHFQGPPHAVSKVITIVKGEAIEFLLDMREASATYGNLQILELNGNAPVSIYIPESIAHGYLSLKDETIISYRQDKAFCANCDGGISGNVVDKYLPIGMNETIRSERDMDLQEFATFKYQSRCKE